MREAAVRLEPEGPVEDGSVGPERRVERWIIAFMVLGIALRLVRFGLKHPLWRDEAYVAVNLLERDFAGLAAPLDFQQVCPLLFLWAEKGIIRLLGFDEWSLRLLPTVASIASLFVLRHVAGRLMGPVAQLFAVAFLAVAYTPIRHGGEVKPYATDLLVVLGLIALAVEWLRAPSRIRWLWWLALLGPVAIAISNPAIFVAASLFPVLGWRAIRERSLPALIALAVSGAATGATFLILLRLVNGPQGESVMPWMQVYWAGSFPPRDPLPLLAWLLKVHTSYAFGYPAGGNFGASSLTTLLMAIGVVASFRRGSRTVLALLLMPFVLGLAASFLGRYPYGGSARVMQYVAPSIIILAGLGVAVSLGRIKRPRRRERAAWLALVGLAAMGVGMIAWDVTHPFKEATDEASREFARRFWAEASAGADLLCARTDLHLPLDTLTWQGDRAAIYVCYQAIFRPRPSDRRPSPFSDPVPARPVRIVVFGESGQDSAVVLDWIDKNMGRFTLGSRSVRTLNRGMTRGKSSLEERYVVYDLIPK